MQKLQIRKTIGKAAILLTAIFLTAIFPAGCAQGGGFSMGGSGDRLRETGDHIAMEAAQGTAAETIRKDAQIIEERLRSFAGEGSYRVETTLPDGQTDAGPATSGRIDIYLDPALKGEESLSYLARVYVSGNLRYALYSIEKGFLNEQEGYYLELSPEDLLGAEVTECPEAFRTSDHGEPGQRSKYAWLTVFGQNTERCLRSGRRVWGWSRISGRRAGRVKTNSIRSTICVLCLLRSPGSFIL